MPLKEWDISIYRGVLTGYNDAFIITGEKRKELISADPKSADIIRPILRGRDIKRYHYEFSDLYIVSTFPSKKYNINAYPAVKEHLLSFGYDRLKQTGDKGARKKTNNKWFETQDSISYWEDFSKQKIIWIELTDHPNFSIDDKGFYLNNTVFFITGNRLKYLTAFLNSKICEWYFDKICATSGVGTRRWIKIYIDQIRVPIVSNSIEEVFNNLIDQVFERRSSGLSFEDIDLEINLKIAKLFGLEQVETQHILSSKL